MICYKCGKNNPRGTEFCKGCGTYIGKESARSSWQRKNNYKKKRNKRFRKEKKENN